MTVEAEKYADRMMQKAMSQFAAFVVWYRTWFLLYFDPLSDDIMCDIEQQAYDYARVNART